MLFYSISADFPFSGRADPMSPLPQGAAVAHSGRGCRSGCETDLELGPLQPDGADQLAAHGVLHEAEDLFDPYADAGAFAVDLLLGFA